MRTSSGASRVGGIEARAVAGLVVFFCSLQLCTIALSLVQIRVSQLLAILVLLLGVAAGLQAALQWRAPGWGDGPTGYRWVGWLAVLPVGLYLLLWYVACVTPDCLDDSNTYHIPPINLWSRTGYIHWVEYFGDDGHANGFPKGIEVVTFIVATALRSSGQVNAVNLLFLPLGVLGVVALARRAGASRWTARWAGSVLLLVPVNVFQAQSAYVDTSFACCVIALLVGTVLGHDAIRDAASPWPAALVLGGSCGLCLGGKGTGLLAVGLALGVLGIALAVERRRGCSGHSARRSAAGLVLAFMIALAVGGYWPVRSWLRHGSPVYPVGLHLAGATVFPGRSVAEVLHIPEETPAAYRPWSGPRRVLASWCQGPAAWPESIRGVDSQLGGLGFFWPLACVPAILAWLLRVVRRRVDATGETALVLPAILTALLYWATPMAWWMRFVIWVYGLGLPLVAVAMDRAVQSRRRVSTALWLGASIGMAYAEGGLSFVKLVRDVYPGRWPPYSLQALRPSAWQRGHSYLFPETRGTVMDDLLASHASVAVGPLPGVLNGRDTINLLGELSLPLGARDLVPLDQKVTSESLEAVRAKGVECVVWDEVVPLPDVLRERAAWQERVPGFWLFGLPPGWSVVETSDDRAGKPDLQRAAGSAGPASEPAVASWTAFPHLRLYHVGDTLDLSSRGKCDQYLGAGWSRPEAWGRWTDGARSVVTLRLASRPSESLDLVVEATPFLALAHRTLAVTVLANGQPVAVWSFEVGHPFGPCRATIPRQALAPEARLHLELQLDQPAAPAALGISEDIRLLGLGVRTMRLVAHTDPG